MSVDDFNRLTATVLMGSSSPHNQTEEDDQAELDDILGKLEREQAASSSVSWPERLALAIQSMLPSWKNQDESCEYWENSVADTSKASEWRSWIKPLLLLGTAYFGSQFLEAIERIGNASIAELTDRAVNRIHPEVRLNNESGHKSSDSSSSSEVIQAIQAVAEGPQSSPIRNTRGRFEIDGPPRPTPAPTPTTPQRGSWTGWAYG